MSFFVNNRQAIKDLMVDVGSSTPSWKGLCCASDIALQVEGEMDDFYVFCDAIQRHKIKGLSINIETTLKLDAENEGVQFILSNLHTALESGTIAQFENVDIKISLLTGVTSNTLTYTTYTANATIEIGDVGGTAEDTSEIPVTFHINGTMTEVTA